MKKIFRQEMTKNWPGGRRKARIDGIWNTVIYPISSPRTENKNITINTTDMSKEDVE